MNDEVKQKLQPTFQKAGVALAYLFGSQTTKHTTAASDIDIAVLLGGRMSKRERFQVRLQLMGAIGRAMKKPVDIVVLNDTHSLFFRYVIITEGELLYERSEEDRLEFETKLLGQYFDYQPFMNEYNAHYVETHLQQNHRQARAAR